jgi:hypothetical protein
MDGIPRRTTTLPICADPDAPVRESHGPRAGHEDGIVDLGST